MAVIVVTRLRLKDKTLLDGFFASAVGSLEQARASAGVLGSDVLADANDAWWTVTAWDGRPSMLEFVGAEPHRVAMTRLDDWCDEATFVEWEQDDAALPDWQTSYRRLIADGQVATLSQPSPAHATRAFAPPVEPAPAG